MNASFSVVTLVRPEIKALIDTLALVSHAAMFGREPRAASREPRAASRESRAASRESPIVVQQADDLASLFSPFDYTGRCCLLVDVKLALAHLQRQPARAVVQSLQALVSCWDCSVLIASLNELEELRRLWKSPLTGWEIEQCTGGNVATTRFVAAATSRLLQSPDVFIVLAMFPEDHRVGDSRRCGALATQKKPSCGLLPFLSNKRG